MSVRTAERPPTSSVPTRGSRGDRAPWMAVGTSILLVAGAWWWGRWLQERGTRLFLNAPPLTGRVDPRLRMQALWAIALGGLGVWLGPVLARRLAWRGLLVASLAGAALWAVALAASDGVAGFLRGPASPLGYLHDVPLVGSPGSFLAGFVDRISTYSVHVRAHPPGMVLLLWGLDRAGLSGPGWVAALEILGGAAAVPAALLALREVAGETAARRAASFLVLTPAALTVAASGDALFAGVGAWSVALVVVATRRAGRRSDLAALGGGLLLGAALFLSYGLALLAAVPVGVALARRRYRPLAVAVAGVAAVVLVLAAAGFWWIEGLLATRREYLASVARFRPYGYFLLADAAAFAVILGPAAVAGMGRLRDREVWPLVGGALAAVLVADLSGMSKGEVERIWLPFAPWVLLAASAIPTRSERAWLAAAVASALALQLLVSMPW